MKDGVIRDDVKVVAIGRLKRNDWNPNEMPEEVYESLKHGITKDGFITPVLVQKKTGIIIDGEHRWRAAKDLGLKKVLVQYIDVDDTLAQELTIAMNQRKGTFDILRLSDLVQSLKKKTENLSHLDLGFTKGKFKSLLEGIKEQGEVKQGASSPELFLIVTCDSEEDQLALYEELTERGLTVKLPE